MKQILLVPSLKEFPVIPAADVADTLDISHVFSWDCFHTQPDHKKRRCSLPALQFLGVDGEQQVQITGDIGSPLNPSDTVDRTPLVVTIST